MTERSMNTTELLIANALETAKQLRELQESPVADAIFESIVENENGKEIQFERPISDLAFAAFLKIEALVEALEAGKCSPIPKGYALVPLEPTRQMMSQGHFAMAGTDRGKFRRIYQAMIAAAPK